MKPLKVLPFVIFCLLSAVSFAQGETSQSEKHNAEIQKDVELGKEYAKEIEKSIKLSEDKVKLDRLERIGKELAEIARNTQVDATWGDSRLSKFDYVFKVVEDKDVNAFSVPGGFIYVHSGLMDNAESDDELAGVVAHEIAHAAHRHLITLSRERNKVDMFTLPLLLAAILGKSKEAGTLVITQQLISTALTSGWSVKAEMDADNAGLQYLVKSKYNPVGLLTFMERLAFQERNAPNFDWGIQRTHPPSRERVSALKKGLSNADVPILRSAVTTSFRVKSTQEEGGVRLSFGEVSLFKLRGLDAPERAGEILPLLNQFFDSTPQLFVVRVDGPRVLWNNKVLVEFDVKDGNGVSPEQLAKDAQANIKKALFSLTYRIG